MLRDLGYNYKADIFSLGSIFFNMLSGRFLFGGSGAEEILLKNEECNLKHLERFTKKFSPLANDLMF
jgi:serine/threonine protein kinase